MKSKYSDWDNWMPSKTQWLSKKTVCGIKIILIPIGNINTSAASLSLIEFVLRLETEFTFLHHWVCILYFSLLDLSSHSTETLDDITQMTQEKKIPYQ